MKIKFLATAAFVLMTSLFATAQTAPLKIGYTSVDFILVSLPESKDIDNKLKTEEAQYTKILQDKAATFQKDYEDFNKNAGSWSELIRNDKQKKLEADQNSINEFQQNIQTQLQKKQQTLISPVIEKIQKAIDAVAKENGYTWVFNVDAGNGVVSILVAPKEDDLSDLVFKKLGVPAPAKAPVAAEPKK
jgi:outer membrane protein